MDPLQLLAQDGSDVGPFIQLIIVFALLALGAIKSLYDKAKEQQAREQQAESPRRPPRPAETPDRGGRSVEEIVRTMREARETSAPAGAPPQPAAQRRPIPQTRPAPPRQVRPTRRPRPAPQPAVLEARRGKRREEIIPKRRGGLASLAAESPVEVSGRPIEIDLADRDEARKGIILAEILGPPVALRRHQGLWDL